MTIYQLECFIAVAEELNFSAAAERLFTTQPAITYQINALEMEIMGLLALYPLLDELNH